MTTITTTLNGKPVTVNVMSENFEADRQAKFDRLFHLLDGTKPVEATERPSLRCGGCK